MYLATVTPPQELYKHNPLRIALYQHGSEFYGHVYNKKSTTARPLMRVKFPGPDLKYLKEQALAALQVARGLLDDQQQEWEKQQGDQEKQDKHKQQAALIDAQPLPDWLLDLKRKAPDNS